MSNELEKVGISLVRQVQKDVLERIARCTNGTIVPDPERISPKRCGPSPARGRPPIHPSIHPHTRRPAPSRPNL
jgi:hypothetical protein